MLVSFPLALAAVPWNDVNLLIVTDVHSWVAGHAHPDHVPRLDANYGHVLSLYEHLSAFAAANGRDLFFVQNGDLNDGTGFSRKPPAALLPLLQRMPFDALTTGNHELYENENIDYLTQSGGFIDSWAGSFLTSNTLNASTGQPLGARSKLLVGRVSGVRVLAFGFLYDMTDHDDHVDVAPVEDVVREAWFLAALNATDAYDALLFLTHMDYADRLVDLLLAAARAVVGAAVPIQFVTGHSHIRAYRDLDARAASFEAGHYLDTVGFASFGVAPAASSFAHLDIDANQASMAAAAGLAGPAALPTAAGAALQTEIARVGAALGLERVLGCAPRTFATYSPFGAADSLWQLYLANVTAEAALGGNASRIVVQSTGSLRYDLYSGRVTANDVWTMCPFADHYWRVAPRVRGDDLLAVLLALHAQAPDAADLSASGTRQRARALASGRLPAYAASSTPQSGEVYELWSLDFDRAAVARAYEAQTGAEARPVRMLQGETTTELWMRWVQRAWPCDNATGGDSAGGGEDDDGDAAGEPREEAAEFLNHHHLLLALVLLLLLALLLLPLLLFCRGRRRRGCFRDALRHVRFMDSGAPATAPPARPQEMTTAKPVDPAP